MKNTLLLLLSLTVCSTLNAQTNGLNGGTVVPFARIVSITNSDGTIQITNGNGPVVSIGGITGSGTNGANVAPGTNITITPTGSPITNTVSVSNPFVGNISNELYYGVQTYTNTGDFTFATLTEAGGILVDSGGLTLNGNLKVNAYSISVLGNGALYFTGGSIPELTQAEANTLNIQCSNGNPANLFITGTTYLNLDNAPLLGTGASGAIQPITTLPASVFSPTALPNWLITNGQAGNWTNDGPLTIASVITNENNDYFYDNYGMKWPQNAYIYESSAGILEILSPTEIVIDPGNGGNVNINHGFLNLNSGLLQINNTNAPATYVLTAIDSSGHVAFAPAVGGSGGPQTPLTNSVNAAGYSIYDLLNLFVTNIASSYITNTNAIISGSYAGQGGTTITNGYQGYANLIGTTISNVFATISFVNTMGTAITNAFWPITASFLTNVSAVSGTSILVGTPSAGNSSSTAIHLTGLGDQALARITTGADNTTIGYLAGNNITTGSNNTYSGSLAGITDNTYDSTGIGYDAFCGTQPNNTAVGAYAGGTGSNDVALGVGALNGFTGSYDIGIGYQASSNSFSGSNDIYLNSSAPANENNTTRIGNSNTTNAYVYGLRPDSLTGNGTIPYPAAYGQIPETNLDASMNKHIITGCYHDCQNLTNGATLINTSALFSGNSVIGGPFQPTDVGKIFFCNVGAAQFSGTITNYSNSWTVAWNGLAGSTVTNQYLYFGHGGDIANINAQMSNYFMYSNVSVFVFPSGNYLCDQWTPVVGSTFNWAEILWLPQTNVALLTNAPRAMKLIGNEPVMGCGTYFNSTSVFGPQPLNTNGVIFSCMLPPQANATYTNCIIGEPKPSWEQGGGFTILKLILENINFRAYTNCQYSAVDLSYVGQCKLADIMVDTGQESSFINGAPTAIGSYGIKFPVAGNYASLEANDCTVIGFYAGYGWSEHLHANNLNAWSCQADYVPMAGNHPNFFGMILAQGSPIHWYNNSVVNTTYVGVFAEEVDTTSAVNSWQVYQNSVYLVTAADQYGGCNINIFNPTGSQWLTPTNHPLVPPNFSIVNLHGPVFPPISITATGYTNTNCFPVNVFENCSSTGVSYSNNVPTAQWVNQILTGPLNLRLLPGETITNNSVAMVISKAGN
jgi:hypothetical protein